MGYGSPKGTGGMMDNRNTSLSVEEIKELGTGLAIDETITVDCLFCNKDWEDGGRPIHWSPEKSLSITRIPAGYLYHCFRASCTKGSGIVGDMLRMPAHRKKEFISKVLDRPLSNVPHCVCGKMLGTYNLTYQDVEDQEIKYDRQAERIYMPVFDYRGYTIGGVAKTIHKGLKPKTILYRHNDVAMLHFPKPVTHFNILVLVEDIISTIKVNKIAPCAALLGTNLNVAIPTLLDIGVEYITLMLDGDASLKAISYKRQYENLFKGFEVVLLPNGKDPKDLSTSKLMYLIYDRSEYY